jgi:hypothetical protein
LAAALLMLLPFAGCKTKPPVTSPIVARVGDRILTADEISTWEASQHRVDVSPDARAAFIQHWVEDELLYQNARDRGLTDDPWVIEKIDDVTRKLLVSRLTEIENSQVTLPASSEIEAYYGDHIAEFVWNKPHYVAFFWKSDHRTNLENIRTGIQHRKLVPGSASEADTGRVDIQDQSTVDAEALNVITRLSLEQISQVVRVGDAYWMFKLLKKDEAGSRQAIEDVSDNISGRLMEEARNRRHDQLVRELIDKYRLDGKLEWAGSAFDKYKGIMKSNQKIGEQDND